MEVILINIGCINVSAITPAAKIKRIQRFNSTIDSTYARFGSGETSDSTNNIKIAKFPKSKLTVETTSSFFLPVREQQYLAHISQVT